MDNIELRAPKIRNIIGEIPPNIVRFGNMILFLILCLLILAVMYLPFPWSISYEVFIGSSNTIYLPIRHCPLKEKNIKMIELKLDAYRETSKATMEIDIYDINMVRDTIILNQTYYRGHFKFIDTTQILLSKDLLKANLEIHYNASPFFKRIKNI
jgi:hypothetical protein